MAFIPHVLVVNTQFTYTRLVIAASFGVYQQACVYSVLAAFNPTRRGIIGMIKGSTVLIPEHYEWKKNVFFGLHSTESAERSQMAFPACIFRKHFQTFNPTVSHVDENRRACSDL